MLKVENLSKSFFLHLLNKKIDVLKDVSFEVSEGEFLAILGKSGSGKSSTIKCIYGTYRPSSGNIIYDGINISKARDREILRARDSIGYVSQYFLINPRVKVIDAAVEPVIKKDEEAYSKAYKLLKMFNLKEELYDVFVSTLSGGEKQRLNIIRAMIKEPKLLLLDEPTTYLDVTSKETLKRYLKKAKRNGMAIVGIFHEFDILDGLADKMAILKNGQIVYYGDYNLNLYLNLVKEVS